MEEWGAKGYCFAFRVCCYEGEPALPYATPKWLRDMGCVGGDVIFRRRRAAAAGKQRGQRAPQYMACPRSRESDAGDSERCKEEGQGAFPRLRDSAPNYDRSLADPVRVELLEALVAL